MIYYLAHPPHDHGRTIPGGIDQFLKQIFGICWNSNLSCMWATAAKQLDELPRGLSITERCLGGD